MKRLWTAPFALGVAAVVVLVLLVGHLLLDRPRREGRRSLVRAAAWALVALGRKSLLVYFGSHLLMLVLTRLPAGGGGGGAGERSLAVAASEAVAVAGHPQLTWSVLLLVSWVALACGLHARGLYLRP